MNTRKLLLILQPIATSTKTTTRAVLQYYTAAAATEPLGKSCIVEVVFKIVFI